MSSLFNIAAGGQAGFYDYQINDSLRFDDGSSHVLNRTPSGTGDSLTTWTWSAWVKRTLATNGMIFSANSSSNQIGFSSDRLYYEFYDGSNNNYIVSTAKLRDPSAWYHVVFVWDTSDATASNRMRMYLNGTQITAFDASSYPTQNRNSKFNTAIQHQIGKRANPSGIPFDGYLAEINFIDGQALDPTSFGETKSGVWIPKDTSGLTFGTNGFRLEFGDSAAIGDDTSGNGNDYTATNLSAHDVVPDSPTNNYCVLNSLTLNSGSSSNGTLSEGNLKWLGTSSNDNVFGTHAVSSEKWYYELRILANPNTLVAGWSTTKELGNYTEAALVYFNSAAIRQGTKTVVWNTDVTTGLTFAVNDIIGFALDIDSGNLKIYQNNTLVSTITLPTDKGDEWIPAFGDSSTTDASFVVNFGQDSTFAGAVTAGGNSDENGYGDFKYAVPSGFLALNSANLPEPSITPLDDDLPEDYFNTVLYTGNSSTQSISVGFQPDFVWLKSLAQGTSGYTGNHFLYDSIRGALQRIKSNSGDVETTFADSLTSFDSNGFSLGSGTNVNNNNDAFVSWNWLAGGTASSNTAGDIDSSVSANTEVGFSIVGYTGDGTSATRTIGCGLTKKPEMVIIKNRTEDGVTDTWFVWHTAFGTASPSKYMTLYNRDAVAASGVFVDSSFSDNSGNALFAVSGSYNGVNKSGTTYIAYCFHSVEGYSKFGGYSGNGGNDGTFVYTGFRPAFVMTKVSSGGTGGWIMQDTTRSVNNQMTDYLLANSDGKEETGVNIDLLSNGFKWRAASGSTTINHNASSDDYIYMAFAEMPFKYANAR